MTQAVSAWRERVKEIPSLFARLIYFATLKETETGPYFCGDLDCSPAEQDEIVRQMHLDTFSQFLALPLRQMANDLIPYLETFGGRVPKLTDLGRDLIPADAGLEAIVLFLGTIQILDSLLHRSRRDG